MDDKKSTAAKVAEPGKSPEPAAAPTQPAPANQPAPAGLGLQPKKKKTGLIIGIVSGVTALILIITAALLYFLWWQNPQKMVADAVVDAITSSKSVSSGEVTIDMGQGNKIELDIKSSSDLPKAKADIAVKATIKEMTQTINVKGSVVTDDEGTVYVKVEGLKKIVEQFIGQMLGNVMSVNPDSGISRSQADAYQKQILEKIEPKLAKLENKWLKISSKDFSDAGTQGKCSDELIEKLKTKKVRDEVADAYRKNSFLIIKDSKVEDRNGGRGFEIDINSKDFREKAKSFGEALEKTEFGEKIKECQGSNSSSSYSSESTTEDIKGTFKVWVDPMSHKMKAFEVKSDQDSVSFKMAMNVDTGKADDIEIPSDADSLREAVEDLVSEFSSLGSSEVM